MSDLSLKPFLKKYFGVLDLPTHRPSSSLERPPTTTSKPSSSWETTTIHVEVTEETWDQEPPVPPVVLAASWDQWILVFVGVGVACVLFTVLVAVFVARRVRVRKHRCRKKCRGKVVLFFVAFLLSYGSDEGDD